MHPRWKTPWNAIFLLTLATIGIGIGLGAGIGPVNAFGVIGIMQTLGLIIVFVFLELPGVVLGEAFLSFIGLGINPPKASWGSLAEDGYTAYATHPYIIIVPSVAIEHGQMT